MQTRREKLKLFRERQRKLKKMGKKLMGSRLKWWKLIYVHTPTLGLAVPKCLAASLPCYRAANWARQSGCCDSAGQRSSLARDDGIPELG